MSYKLVALNVGPLLPPSVGMEVMAKMYHSFDSAEYGLYMVPIIIVLDLKDIEVETCYINCLFLKFMGSFGAWFWTVFQIPLVFNCRTLAHLRLLK